MLTRMTRLQKPLLQNPYLIAVDVRESNPHPEIGDYKCYPAERGESDARVRNPDPNLSALW